MYHVDIINNGNLHPFCSIDVNTKTGDIGNVQKVEKSTA